MKTDWRRIIRVLGIMAANIAFDQATKQLAREYLAGRGQLSYLGDTFRLAYVENKGAFLSLGAGLSDNLRFVALHILPVALLLGLLAYTLFSQQLRGRQIIAFSFIVGGGFSNVIDRILYGQVVDFMNMGLAGLRTGIFNFADLSIMIGLVIMLPEVFGSKKAEQPPAGDTPEE
ncbi:MAG: signal peptidase II [Lewinellaceae bacterium]|nr:signal peptidase II [Lewinellaceae bacterium]